jgi:hypothetical protein
MAGLVPAIHAAPVPANPKLFRQLDDVDDRDKPGHDGVGFLSQRLCPYFGIGSTVTVDEPAGGAVPNHFS